MGDAVCVVVCVCVRLHQRQVYILCCVACMSISFYICHNSSNDCRYGSTQLYKKDYFQICTYMYQANPFGFLSVTAMISKKSLLQGPIVYHSFSGYQNLKHLTSIFWQTRFDVTIETTIVSIVMSNQIGQNQPVNCQLTNQILYPIGTRQVLA